jgi:hypothetical protein
MVDVLATAEQDHSVIQGDLYEGVESDDAPSSIIRNTVEIAGLAARGVLESTGVLMGWFANASGLSQAHFLLTLGSEPLAPFDPAPEEPATASS